MGCAAVSSWGRFDAWVHWPGRARPEGRGGVFLGLLAPGIGLLCPDMRWRAREAEKPYGVRDSWRFRLETAGR